jgi:hypothetical protein
MPVFPTTPRGGGDLVSTDGVGAEHPVVPGEMEVGARDEGGEPMQELGRLEDDGPGAARAERPLELVTDSAVLEQGEALLREGLTSSIADEAQEALSVVGSEGHIRVQGETVDVGAAVWRLLVGLALEGYLAREGSFERKPKGDIEAVVVSSPVLPLALDERRDAPGEGAS